jgi:transposase
MTLLCAEGQSNIDVAAAVGLTTKAVADWRRRWEERGLDGLDDAPRSGGPRKATDERIAELVKKTLETVPKGASRWSTRSMAQAMGLDRDTVSRIWRAFGLKPHRSETFQISADPNFVEKVQDVVGLYMAPPDNALVLSVDEKTQIQALNRTQPMLPLRPGQLERRTPEYQRNGTTTLFAALDVATGRVIGKCTQRHRTEEFIEFLRDIDKATPPNLALHLVLDNYATHKTPAVHRWLVRHPRFHLHFTPTHASWLNQVETFFSILTEKQLKRGNHFSTRELEAAIRQFLDAHNAEPKPFRWTKSADQILANVASMCSRTVAAHPFAAGYANTEDTIRTGD